MNNSVWIGISFVGVLALFAMQLIPSDAYAEQSLVGSYAGRISDVVSSGAQCDLTIFKPRQRFSLSIDRNADGAETATMGFVHPLAKFKPLMLTRIPSRDGRVRYEHSEDGWRTILVVRSARSEKSIHIRLKRIKNRDCTHTTTGRAQFRS